MSRIPLILVAGFLGSGKTTFLRALMQALKERRVPFSVVVNDFENAEVDAARLRSLGAEVRAIDGSCVCCSSLNEFMQALENIGVPGGGVLLVEANGASDLVSLIAAITVRHECRRFASPVQVTMIDATRWQQRGDQDALEREQTQTSTHWYLSHGHGQPAWRLEKVRCAVKELAPRSAQTSLDGFADFVRLHAATARFSPQEEREVQVFDPVAAGAFLLDHHHHHHGERAFTSMRLDLPFVLHRRDLERTLQALPESVLRVKGICRLAELPQLTFNFQHVRPEGETWFLPMPDVTDILPTAVVVGVGMPALAIQARFDEMPSAELRPEPTPTA